VTNCPTGAATASGVTALTTPLAAVVDTVTEPRKVRPSPLPLPEQAGLAKNSIRYSGRQLAVEAPRHACRAGGAWTPDNSCPQEADPRP
jgi:hypothetical protein